ncbi:MAG TPA: GGDEF domain-containing protein [Myxococcales bacterium]|jgi:diguanylate cyclase (GGDEF)-like protein|nr:GGDEF domain-containing protein [Myxococcales bacterium]
MTKSGDPKARTFVTVPSAAPGDLPKSSFMLVLTGTRFGELYKLPLGRAVRIGRGEEADIRLDDEGISRVHCSLEARGPEAILRDLGSQNGTYVGGERTQERVLVDGDRVQIGAATTFKIAYADEVEVNYQRRLAEIALRDPLTGVYNRRHFGERLTSEFAASRRYARPLSLVMLDVDHLNRVNEAHGRPAGDEVLRGVAQVLQGVIRGADVVARVGGDEFAVLLRETELSGAQRLAERLRQSIEELRTHFDGKEIAVTATFGLAVDVPERAREVDQPRELVERCERALDRQKELGINRVGN